MSNTELILECGLKTDPIEYRCSFEWLFRLLAEEGIRHVQLGTFFELYQLPDAWFRNLRRQAEDFGLGITSMFTAHRELGGFFRDDGPGWVEVADRNYRRLIEVGGLLGAKSVGSNPGAVLRDRMGSKAAGIGTYISHMKQLMHFAADCGVQWLTIEPMSCLAEPPTLPREMTEMAEELAAHHKAFAGTTANIGFCLDVSHGYADAGKRVRHAPLELLEAALPWTSELHLKNTDALFHSTFGFTPVEREKGIVDVARVRSLLMANADKLPVKQLVGYLEIGGPKLGRDYSDGQLEELLRQSIRHVKQTFAPGVQALACSSRRPEDKLKLELRTKNETKRPVQIAPSLMCADQCHLEESVCRLEAVGADILHVDLMDSLFTPNLPMGLVALAQLRPKTALPMDVHLMVENNDLFVRELAKLGVNRISVHVESCRHLDRTLNAIRDAGIQAGAALNPATPLSAIEYVLESLDFVLIMTVNPGFAGQKLVPSAMRKIGDCRAMLDAAGRHIPVEVDGNVSFENIPKMVAAGADILVAGSSSVFSTCGTLVQNMERTRQAIGEGLKLRQTAQAAKEVTA